MILLDTHIWIWWVNESEDLTDEWHNIIKENSTNGLGISIISCWEIAKLVELKRLNFSLPVEDWISQALAYPGIKLLNLTPQIAVESSQLPGTFHRDPADQMIVATARIYDIPLLTADRQIRDYAHVKLATLHDEDDKTSASQQTGLN